MSLCKDCKHIRQGFGSAVCFHPKNGIDPVYGFPEGVNCHTARASVVCGPSGDLFEKAPPPPTPKPTLWERIKAHFRSLPW